MGSAAPGSRPADKPGLLVAPGLETPPGGFRFGPVTKTLHLDFVAVVVLPEQDPARFVQDV